MRTKTRIIAIVLSAALLFSCLSVLSGATAEEDFITLVEGIDDSLSYGERRQRAELIDDKYDSLTPEQKEAVASYYSAYLAELSALSELADEAEAFLAVISELDDATSLLQKEGIVTRAKAAGVYFSDTTYPGISAALGLISEIEDAVGDCKRFIGIVEQLADLSPENYLEYRAKLDEASEARVGIDMGYPGVEGAVEALGFYSLKVSDKEEYTETTLELLEELEYRVNYSERKRLYNDIMQRMSNGSFIAEYPGVSELLEVMDTLSDYFAECELKAAEFVTAYRAIGSADSLFIGLCNALEYADGVDSSVVGVADALSSLEGAIENYNDTAADINAAFSGM